MLVRPRRLLVLLAASGVVATAAAGAAGPRAKTATLADALKRRTVAAEPRARAATPEDRYAPAGGCYVAKSAASGKYVTRAGDAWAATATRDKAEPIHFQAYDLGKYLLFASQKDYVAVEADPTNGGPPTVARVATGYVKGTGDENLDPVRDPAVGAVDTLASTADGPSDAVAEQARGEGVVVAAAPSAAAEWVLKSLDGGGFTLQNPVDDSEPENPGPLDPAIRATLTATKDGALAATDGAVTGDPARFTFELATGCATFPEITTNVSGPVAAGATPYGETQGYFDAHLHAMAFEFIGGKSRCGRPWHPYGVAYALVDCPDHEPGGHGAVLEAALSGSNPAEGHDTVGWPTFGYWPKYSSLTHEQVYYKWLERSWQGGLRMFTNLLVDNNVLCELYPYKKNSCNEMDGVRLQAQRLHELERYVDAQSGGPGRGWFRIVKDPFEARRVINDGKLAVVMGIEVSVPFDCGEYLNVTRPGCDAAAIKSRLQEVYDLGVRQMELTNKFDNALTGVTGDNTEQGVIVNAGNKYETGHNWQMETCDHPENGRTDRYQYNVSDGVDGNAPPEEIGRDAIFSAVLEQFGKTGAAPVYSAGPHCNVVGLSDLGRDAIRGMSELGMVFDPDHMSAKAREQAMDYLANTLHYGGIVSSHSWADDPTYQAILKLGGVVTPHAGRTTTFVEKWRKLREWSDDRYLYGIGFGSDVNGFSTQGSPRNPSEANDVDYPFTGLGGVTVDMQRSGEKTYDYNKTGTDHYGLYPDWVEDARLVAGADGAQLVADLARGAEAYLQMWERAIGIRPNACRADVTDLTKAQMKALPKSATPEQVLAAVGQPDTRVGETFTYCVEGGKATVTFDKKGTLRNVALP
ncbi:MAG TPA: hypothetical protein VGX28_15355 [Frankiaceae bacterium]|jgi:hypothetical protein|nr:hypothetical protein [Frankiaceae bacterium]